MRAGPLGLRLFLEGVEIPVISAQVTMQPGAPAAAAIQIVPLDQALSFLPRTCVHLFFLEKITEEDTETQLKLQEEGRADLNRLNAADVNYKLLFAGEVIGYNYSKSPSSRQLILQCMDLSSYWDTCYQWFADYSAQGSGLTDTWHTFVGAGSGLFDNIARGGPTVISQLLNTSPASPEYANVQGLQAGMIHVLEAIGGIRPRGKTFRGYSGTNDFFTIAELRYNLLGMLGAVEKDSTSKRIYAAKAFSHWLHNGMTSLGNLVSFRDIVRHIGRWIFHDIYPVTTPYFKRGGKRMTYTATASAYTDSAGGIAARTHFRLAVELLNEAIRVVGTVETLQQTNTTIAMPYYMGKVVESLKEVDIGLGSAEVEIRGGKTDDVRKVGTMIKEVRKDAKDATLTAESLKAVGIAFTQFAKSQVEALGRKLITMVVKVKAIIDSPKTRGKKKVASITGAFMYTQLLLPETYFVSPPRCNVIFPDQYSEFQYNRNFMREVTRLKCMAGLGLIAGRRGAQLLGSNYFAPSIKGTGGKTLYATLSRGAKILLPHEIHSGIIPKMEWLTDAHKWGSKSGTARRESNDDFYKAGKVGYVQRLAHFQFFQHRWMSRSMALSGKFNPYLVIGFPAVIIDRPALPPKIDDQGNFVVGLDFENLPTQYIGKVMALTHNISQTGGTTSASFTHCRTHRGRDDEFLDVLMRRVQTFSSVFTDKKGGTDAYSYLNGAIDILKEAKTQLSAAMGPTGLFNRIVLADQNLSGWVDGPVNALKEAGRWISSASDLVQKGNTDDAKKTVAELKSLSAYAYDVANEVMRLKVQAALPIKPMVTKIDEIIRDVGAVQKTTTTRHKKSEHLVKMSIEDAIMPGWYSEVWQKENISEDVYTPLLGAASITDGEAIGGNLLTSESFDEEPSEEKKFGGVGSSTIPVSSGGKIDKYEIPTDSIERAIDGLTVLYGLLKAQDQDVHQFIEDYTRRPIASLIDVMGSSNFVFGADGAPENKKTMIEGFHSRAFGDYNSDMKVDDQGEIRGGKKGLYDLIESSNQGDIKLEPVIIRGEKVRPIPGYLDPRGRARRRVLDYADEIKKRRGFYAG